MMTEDNNRSGSRSETTSSVADQPASTARKRIEDMLIDEDTVPRSTFRDLAEKEVKSGKGTAGSLRWPLTIFALLLVVIVIVAAWYQFADRLIGQSQVQVEKRMAVPVRPQLQEAPSEIVPEIVVSDDGVVRETGTVSSESVTEMDTKVPFDAAEESFSADAAVVSTEDLVISEENASEAVLAATETVVSEEPPVKAESSFARAIEPVVHRILVGPFISHRDLERAATLLRARGFEPEQQHGSGTVDMIRLLEGIYPLVQAQQRLEEVRNKFPSAFLLPDGDRWALYIGSFSDRERARRQQRELADHQIQVAQVDSQLKMEGPLLVVVRDDGLKAAEEVAAEVNASGLRARIESGR